MTQAVLFRETEPALVVTVKVVLHTDEPDGTPIKLPSITSCNDALFASVIGPLQFTGAPGPIGGIQVPCELVQVSTVNCKSTVS